jgi:predicted O-linked N-acetylglucosamine transferase (SPINDLY family)
MLKQQLSQIRNLIQSHQTGTALQQLQQLQDTVPQKDAWRLHELFGACFHDLGEAEGAAQAYWHAMQTDTYLRSQCEHLSNYLFCLHYLDGITDEEMFKQHQLAGRLYQAVDEAAAMGSWIDIGHRQPSIGFLAPDFCQQASASFFQVLIAGLAQRQWQVSCYSLNDQADALTAAVSQYASYRSLAGLELATAVQFIRTQQHDIVFDLGGHSAGGMTLMLSAQRLAPVQIAGIGWFDTTAVPAIDFFLADETTAPTGKAESCFTETLLRLPHQFCYVPDRAIASLTVGKRQEGPLVFGSFNNYMKITDKMLRLWHKILMALPEARLVLKDTTPYPARQHYMQQRLQRLGIDDAPIELRPASRSYLQEYQDIDIALDTYPYTGGATTCEALYLGIPVITRCGTRYGSCMGASLLEAAQLPELITTGADAYCQAALALAGNRQRLSHYRSTLREHLQASPLLDAETYMADAAAALQRLIGGISIHG